MASHKNGWWFVIGCSLNAIHSRTRRLERSLIRTLLCRLPEQEPRKSSISQTAFIQRKPANSSKVTKSREQNKRIYSFFCRDGVTSRLLSQSYEKSRKCKTFGLKRLRKMNTARDAGGSTGKMCGSYGL